MLVTDYLLFTYTHKFSDMFSKIFFFYYANFLHFFYFNRTPRGPSKVLAEPQGPRQFAHFGNVWYKETETFYNVTNRTDLCRCSECYINFFFHHFQTTCHSNLSNVIKFQKLKINYKTARKMLLLSKKITYFFW